MGTEVGLSFSALRAQLENEKSSLFKIDENIKKIVQTGSGRFPNDRFNPAGEYTRGGARVGGRNSFPDGARNSFPDGGRNSFPDGARNSFPDGGRNSFPDGGRNSFPDGGRNSLPDGGDNYNKTDEHFGKRKQETKTVFSRLSARGYESDGDEEMSEYGAPVVKRVKMPSAVSRELPTRAAVLRAQGGDEQARTRNRRMFGSLLGTLQKFKQEEIVLQTKEEKKAQVERKIEEAARLEKEREQKERKTLFAEREHKKATIRTLEAKMARVAEFEKWESSQKHLGNFILTKAKPHIYWLPKKMTEKAGEKLMSSRKFHEKYMSKKREELQEELLRIEQRVHRPRGAGGPAAKENKPALVSLDDTVGLNTNLLALNDTQTTLDDSLDDGAKKRDKFAMDVDKDESDDDRHDEELKQVKQTTATEAKNGLDKVSETTIDTSKVGESTQSTDNTIENGDEDLVPPGTEGYSEETSTGEGDQTTQDLGLQPEEDLGLQPEDLGLQPKDSTAEAPGDTLTIK